MRLSPARWASHASPSTPTLSKGLVAKSRSRGSPRFGGKSHDNKRRNIINPELCHQAVALVRSQLPASGKCDIIDINPGACVWSQALHDALRPRRHVLVELDMQTYHEPVESLLQQPRSRYRHTNRLLDALDLTKDLLSPSFKQHLSGLSAEEGLKVRRTPTDQLIVTANLSSRSVVATGFSGALSKFFIDQYRRAVAFDSGMVNFNNLGLAKLLAWVPEKDKYSFLPRCTSYRGKLAVALEACCHVREIVGGIPLDGVQSQRRPWHGAAMQSVQEVARKQGLSATKIPRSRRLPTPEPPSSFFEPEPKNFDKLSSLKQKPDLVGRYLQAYKSMELNHPKWLKSYFKSGPKDLPLREQPSEIQEFAQLRIRMNVAHNHYHKVEELACEQIGLEQELVQLRRQCPDDLDRYTTRLAELESRFAVIKARHAAMFKDDRHAFIKAIDDYRALLPEPHVMSFNNRDFEPLLSHPEEDFLPHQPMCLIEVSPKQSFLNQINTGLRAICFDYIVQMLDPPTAPTVEKALERVLQADRGSEVYQDFVHSVPSLTDPLAGGHWDLASVRTRTMPVQTMIDLAIAYEAWPFRKDEGRIMEVLMNSKDNISDGAFGH